MAAQSLCARWRHAAEAHLRRWPPLRPALSIVWPKLCSDRSPLSVASRDEGQVRENVGKLCSRSDQSRVCAGQPWCSCKCDQCAGKAATVAQTRDDDVDADDRANRLFDA